MSLCTAILISKITSANGIARGSYGMIIAQLEAREEPDRGDEGPWAQRPRQRPRFEFKITKHENSDARRCLAQWFIAS